MGLDMGNFSTQEKDVTMENNWHVCINIDVTFVQTFHIVLS